MSENYTLQNRQPLSQLNSDGRICHKQKNQSKEQTKSYTQMHKSRELLINSNIPRPPSSKTSSTPKSFQQTQQSIVTVSEKKSEILFSGHLELKKNYTPFIKRSGFETFHFRKESTKLIKKPSAEVIEIIVDQNDKQEPVNDQNLELKIQKNTQEIKNLKMQLDEKNRILFNYEKEINSRNNSCLKCYSKEQIIQKLKQMIVNQNKMTLQSIYELEQNRDISSLIHSQDCDNEYYQLTSKIDSQVKQNTSAFKDLLSQVMQLDNENKSLTIIIEKLQNQGRFDKQDYLTSIHQLQDEVKQLRNNEENFKSIIEKLNQEQIKLLQENIDLKGRIKTTTKIDRDTQTFQIADVIQEKMVHQSQEPKMKSAMNKTLDRLQNFSEILLAQSRNIQ